MLNFEYRISRGTQEEVDLSHAEETWLKICQERQACNYKNCIVIPTESGQFGSIEPIKQNPMSEQTVVVYCSIKSIGEDV